MHPFLVNLSTLENPMHTTTRANLLLPIERLEAALDAPYLGQERAWVQGVADALTATEHALLCHAADAASPDGVFAEVDSNRRGLVNQVAALRQEMTGLLGETAALQEWAKKVAEPGHAGTTARSMAPLSDRVTELIAALRDLVGGEHDVVMESINMDLGAGD